MSWCKDGLLQMPRVRYHHQRPLRSGVRRQQRRLLLQQERRVLPRLHRLWAGSGKVGWRTRRSRCHILPSEKTDSCIWCKRKRGQTRSDNSYSTQFARQNPLCTRFPRPSSTFPFCQHELHLSEKDSSSEEISFSFFDQVCFRSSHCETLSGFLKIIPVRNNIMSNLVRSAGPEEAECDYTAARTRNVSSASTEAFSKRGHNHDQTGEGKASQNTQRLARKRLQKHLMQHLPRNPFRAVPRSVAACEHTDEQAGRAGVAPGPHSSGRPCVVLFCPLL